MKVVLFCGGKGVRIRKAAGDVPKPMVKVGYRPILWHLMKYYAHHGHRDFILCLGYRPDAIKRYFLEYNEAFSNDFSMSAGGHQVDLFKRDISDWKITFVDTGLNATIGQRLLAVKHLVQDDEMFLANYADGLSDAPMNEMIERLRGSNAVASFIRVKPMQSFHTVVAGEDGIVQDIRPMTKADIWVNGGFFALRRAIFDHMNPGDELVEQPFHRLIAKKQLLAYTYNGFWGCMDTFKEKQVLESLYAEGKAPWCVWDPGRSGASAKAAIGPRLTA